jgi:hypothetical protein
MTQSFQQLLVTNYGLQPSGYTGSQGAQGTAGSTAPKISAVQVTNSSYTVLDDTAVDVAGGYIQLVGTGFESGCQVLINNIPAMSTTFVSATEVRAQVPATTAGTYIVYLVNSDGGVAIRINGITFSATPTWVSGSALSGDSDVAISIQLSATGASTYSVAAGSTLPAGLTLSSSGLLSGTVTGLELETVYNFTVNATDADLQDSPRSFAITISAGDPQIRNVTALLSSSLEVLPFNDDASANNFAVSVVGDTRPNNFSPYTPGYYSNYFDGSGDYLSVAYNAALDILSGNFTVECWINHTATQYDVIASSWGQTGINSTDGWIIRTGDNNELAIDWAAFSTNTTFIATANNVIQTGRWHHVAFTRSGNTFNVWVDGVSVGTGTSAGTNSSQYRIDIGFYGNGSLGASGQSYFNGYISNLRIVKGTAVYTAAFTPATTPLTAVAGTSLLTCQSNRFIDNSTNNFAITRNGDVRIDGFDPFAIPTEFAGRGSTYFDGSTSNYLTAPAGNAFLLNGDFTVEAYAYFTNAATTYDGIFTTANGTSAPQVGVMISKESAQILNGIDNSSGFSYTAPINQWNHIAFVRSGTTIACWLNGARVGSATTTIVVSTNSPVIGKRYSVLSNNFSMNGYVCDLRVVKGTAVYNPSSTTISVPTAPLNAISGTSLLTCQTNQPVNNNTFLDSSTNNFLITRNGNPTQGSFSPYGGGWSYLNSGTGNTRLSIANNAALQFGTGDFTVEFWAYITGQHPTDSYTGILSFGGVYGTANTCLEFTMSPNGGVGVVSFTNTTANFSINLIAENSGLLFNTWHHFAVSRSGTTVRAFTDGVLKGTVTGNSTNINGTGIGAIMFQRLDSSVASTPGYISNVRALKGVALYTASFTPSTSPLQPITGTSLLTCADNRFVDDSPNNFTITRNGDVSVQKINPFGIQTAMTPVSYGAYFDGTGDYLTLSAAPVAATGTFTIECWVYVTGTAAAQSIYGQYLGGGSAAPGRWNMLWNDVANKFSFSITTSSYESSSTYSTNTWYHIAWVRDESNNLSLYVNGLRDSTTAGVSASLYTGNPIIGARNDGTTPYTGYISNFRVTNTVVYSGTTYTVPTSQLTAIAGTTVLTCQSPTFVDNSTNRFAITAAGNAIPSQINPFGYTASIKTNYTPAVFGGSMFYGTRTNSLGIPASTGVKTFAGDFTFEAWVYPTNTAITQWGFWDGRQSGQTANPMIFNIVPLASPVTGQGRLGYYNGTSHTGTGIVLYNSWSHVAWVRRGSTMTFYVNGVAGGTVTVSGTQTANATSNPIFIGSKDQAAGAEYGTVGYISDLRVNNGTAVYTSSFVPPSAPLAPVANTTLLLNGTSAAVRDASMSNNLETAGDARVTTAVVKYGTTSVFFDGTSDYLTLSNTAPIGAGDFTIEGWAWLGAIGDAYYNFYGPYPFGIRYANNGFANRLQFSYDFNTAASIYNCQIQSGNGYNQWIHMAWTRASGTNRFFFNGVQQNLGTGSGPSTFPLTSFSNSSSPPTSGVIGDGWVGYIQDFRITRGVARYTATFTPPAGAFKAK